MPLDFDAPLGETWAGYVRPDETCIPPCTACKGRGETAASRWLQAVGQLVSMLGQDYLNQQRGRPMHPYLSQLQNSPRYEVGRPSEDILELVTGLCGEPTMMGFPHSHRPYQKLVAAAGVRNDWGMCPNCNGEGSNPTPEEQERYDAWQPTEPPTGDGWQLWQTVSEGGPVSPVFPTPEGLAHWLTTPHAGMDRMDSKAAALRFVHAGWAPSGGWEPDTGHMTGTVLIGHITDPERQQR